MSEAVLYSAADQKLLEDLEMDFAYVNASNNPLEPDAMIVDIRKFDVFFIRLNQLRQFLNTDHSDSRETTRNRLIAELLVVIHGYWKNPKPITEPQFVEEVSLFDDLCLAEYPELCGLICALQEKNLIDAQVLQRLIDQLPFDADPRSLSQRLRQYTQETEWRFVLNNECWDETSVLEPFSIDDPSSSSFSLPRCGACLNLSDLERQKTDDKIGQEAREVAQKIMSDILTQGFFALHGDRSLEVRSRSCSLTVMVDGE